MKRMVAAGLGMVLVSLALGGCPSGQQQDPQAGVVSVLTAGSYSGPLTCKAESEEEGTKGLDPVQAKVLVTEEGGLRLYADNMAPGETLRQTASGIVFEELVGQISQTADTVTIPTTGTITASNGRILTERTVTLKQVDATHIEMTDRTKNTGEALGKIIVNTCTGSISR